MYIPDGFVVYLRNLDPCNVSFELVDEDEPRHILHVTTGVALYVRRDHDKLPEVIEGLRKLAAAAAEMAAALDPAADVDHAIAADVDAQIQRDGEALGDRIAADEGIEPAARVPLDVIEDEPEADPVPWPTGLCGHPVPPGAWAVGFTRCRDDISPEHVKLFDEAARNLTVVDDEDGEQR